MFGRILPQGREEKMFDKGGGDTGPMVREVETLGKDVEQDCVM